MKKQIINISTTYPRQTIIITVILSLLLAIGIFNLKKTAFYTVKAFKTRSLLSIAKDTILYPIRVYIRKDFRANPELFRLRIDDNIINMLPKDLPSRLTWERLEDTFGSTEFTIIAFGAEGRDIINTAALDKVIRLSNALEDLDEVDEVRSLYTLNKIEASEGGFTVSPMLDEEAPRDKTELDAINHYLNKHPDIKSNFVSVNNDFTSLLVIYNTEGVDEAEAAGKVTALADSIIGNERVVIAGTPFLRGIIVKNILGDLIMLMPIVILVLFILLIITFRTAHAIPLVFQVVILSVLPTLGLMGWLNQRFMLINSTMPVILLTIACADSIHIISRFFRELKVCQAPKKAVQRTMNSLMLPVFLTSITTVAAFITLTASPITAMIPFGLFISFGVSWAWLLSVTLLPARLVSYKASGRIVGESTDHFIDRIVNVIGKVVCRRPKTVLTAGIFLIIISAIGIFRVNIEVNFDRFFPKSNPVRIANEFIDKNMDGVMNISIEFTGNDIKEPRALRAVEDVTEELERIPGMGTSISIASIIAKMNRAIHDDDPKKEVIPDTRNQVAQLLELYSMSGDPEDFESLVNHDYTACLINAKMKSISTDKITEVIRYIESYISESIDPSIGNFNATGFSVFIRDFVGLVIRSSLISIIFSMFLVFLISLLFFRSLKWAPVSILPLSSAVVLIFGLMGYFGIELSHVTALMTSIIIGVGIDFAMHFITHARDLLDQGIDRENVVFETIDEVGRPIIINALSVAFGFSVLLFSNFIPMRFLGSLVGLSMLSCAFGALTVMASIVHLSRNRLYGKKIEASG